MRCLRGPLVVGEPEHEDTLREAGVEGALACGLLIEADLANLHVALELQQLAPQARIVVRLFNTSLASAMRSLVREVTVLSTTELAGGDEVQVVGTALGLAELERRVAPPSDANECDETALGARVLESPLYRSPFSLKNCRATASSDLPSMSTASFRSRKVWSFSFWVMGVKTSASSGYSSITCLLTVSDGL